MEAMSTVCAGCLCIGRALRDVLGSPYEEYFARVLCVSSSLSLEAHNVRVCWECAATIRRISSFRDQVQRSSAALTAYLLRTKQTPTQCDLTQISRPCRLNIETIEITSFPPNSDERVEIKHEDDLYCSDSEIKTDCNNEEVKDDSFQEDVTMHGEIVLDVDVKYEPIEQSGRKIKKAKLKKRKKKRNKTEITKESGAKFKNSLRVKDKLKKSLKTEGKVKLEHTAETSLEEKETERIDINSKGKTKSGKERVRRNVSLDPEKIRSIVLSPGELLLERASDAQSEAYLKLPYKCESCIQGFDHEQTLADHMDRKHNLALGKFQCDTCKSVLSSHASYSTHCRRHLLRFECAACGKRTIDKAAMLKHYGAEHEAQVTRYTCADCGFLSQSYRAHRYHKEKHKEKPQCADCGKSFINKNSLRCHMLNMHGGGRRFACGACDKSYRGKSGLLMHMWTHDARARAHAYCAPCRVHFNTLYNYQNHLRTSRKHRAEQELLYACGECEKRFPTRRQAREHTAWAHLRSADHQCQLCSKMFKHRVGLERHRKYVHEKLRPPRDKMCHHCGRGFTTSSILRTHIRTHTGERPLSCAACPATFSHSAALYTHNKLVHHDTRTRE